MKAYVQETPSYEVTDEEGYPSSAWNFFVEMHDDAGNVWAHKRDFPATGYGKEQAQALADRVNARGSFNPKYWDRCDAWAPYRTPQTYEEEKAAALDAEANEPAYGCYRG